MLVVKNLSYRYPLSCDDVLKNIDFQVLKNEFIGIVGANKAGKSTLCQALNGLVPHFYGGTMQGKVLVNGIETTSVEIPDLVTMVGLVMQEPKTQLSSVKKSVFAEIAFGLENIGIPVLEIKKRVKEIVKKLKLEEIAYRHPLTLSGGQLQKVIIASVLVMEPKILVLDEPTSQLDPKATLAVFDLLLSLKKAGKTIVIAENKPELLAKYCTKLLWLEEGYIKAFASPSTVFNATVFKENIKKPVYFDLALMLKKIQNFKEQELLPVLKETAKEYCLSFLDRSSVDTAFLKEKITERSFYSNVVVENNVLEPMLSIKNLSFAYEKKEVLKNIALDFTCGTWAIVGQNGAGKTTLVKLLKKLLSVNQKGKIKVKGQDLYYLTAAQTAKYIGLVFQNPNEQIFKATVLEEVLVGPLAIGQSREDALKNSQMALEETGLWGLRKENPYDLTLAERKLLTLASVLAMKTAVVILDEPTMAQDANGICLIGKIIQKLEKEGCLVLAILHDMDFAIKYFAKAIVLCKGEVVFTGSSRELVLKDEILKQAGLEKPYFMQLVEEIG